jgi:hypothetical protein
VACILTFATCVLLGLPLNFANIIVLPLLLGIGVAFPHLFRHGVGAPAGTISAIEPVARRALQRVDDSDRLRNVWLSRHPGPRAWGNC